MADQNKFEQMLELLINEDKAAAEELFHEIVVEKSRDIYESLIDEQDLEEVGGNEVEGLVNDVTMDETGISEEEENGEESENGNDPNKLEDEALKWMLVKHRETQVKKKENRLTYCQEEEQKEGNQKVELGDFECG